MGTVDIQHVDRDDWVMYFVGEHDVTTVDLIKASFDAIGQPYRLVVVDLTDCAFIEAIAIGTILSHRNGHGELRLLVPTSGPVSRLVEVIDLAHRIPLYWSLDDALAS